MRDDNTAVTAEPGAGCGSGRTDPLFCEHRPSFWIKGAFGPQPRVPEGFGEPGSSLLSFGSGWAQPHRGLCFALNYPSGSTIRLSFISTARLSARQFEQSLIWSVLTLLPRRWQRSGIGSALGLVVSKHTFAQTRPLPQPYLTSEQPQIRKHRPVWKRP